MFIELRFSSQKRLRYYEKMDFFVSAMVISQQRVASRYTRLRFIAVRLHAYLAITKKIPLRWKLAGNTVPWFDLPGKRTFDISLQNISRSGSLRLQAVFPPKGQRRGKTDECARHGRGEVCVVSEVWVPLSRVGDAGGPGPRRVCWNGEWKAE